MPSQNPDDYSRILETKDLALLEREVLAAEAVLSAEATPQSRAAASLLRQAFIELLADLDRLAKKIAAMAQTEIREREALSRVRDDTGGGGGPRLNDYLGESMPNLLGVEGSVGINYEPTLYDNVPWWWTNEEGYSGFVGKSIGGFFFDAGFTGASRPNIAEFREHPLFRPSGPKKGKIENPIPDRWFVRDGGKKAAAVWHAEYRRIEAKFAAKRRRALAAPTVPRLRPPRRP